MSERSVFLLALDLPDPTDRAAYLDAACAGDDALRGRVEELLAAAASGSFMDRPAADQLPTPGWEGEPPTGTPTDGPTGLAGTVLAGRYTLVETVGEGGMGAVWRAKQTDPVKRTVAVKVIKAGMDSKQVLARFEAERQALALMDHPNIAKVLDGGLHENRPFFVMELVKGVPITDFCDARKLTPRERLELFVPVCQAIQHAHQKGIIHRDIKPSNVLVALYDDRPVPKVIDFGIAKATGGALTERTIDTGFGGVVGTPQYMSPEQATFNNLDVDTRADVYSLGVLLYELLTGSPPFSKKELAAKGLMEMLRVVREDEPPRPSTKLSTADALPSISANRGTEPRKLTGLLRNELDWVVMKALEKDRSRRYATANGFAADVLRYLAGEAVQAHPPGTAYRLRKFVRRNRGPVVAAGVVLLALLAGIAGTTFGLVRAEERRREAVAAQGQTQKRLAQIEKGVELFAGVLTGINPRAEEQGGDPLYEQLRRRAEKAADALDAEAVGDPQAVARLQTVLGTTLRDLGSKAKAVEVLEKARATRERELGADHPDTLATLHSLGVAYQDAGRLADAVALLERVREARVKKLGAAHPESLAAAGNLADAYRVAGKPRKAIDLCEHVRDVQLRELGADHPDTLGTLANLAKAYWADGKLPEAIALWKQVRDARVKKQGRDHPDTLDTVADLASAYQMAGQLTEAIALYEQVRDAQVKKLGADHPNNLTTLSNLAAAYRAAGRLPEAIALFERVRDGRVRKLGADHPDTLRTLAHLASAYPEAGRLPEAIALFEQVRDAQVRKVGADHPDTLRTLVYLTWAYRAGGKLPQAIALGEQLASGIGDRLSAHEDADVIVGNLAKAYEQVGQPDKAEGWRRRWLAVVKEKAGADSADYADYADELAALGSNLLLQEKWADAEPVLRECLAVREKKQPDVWQTFHTRSLLGVGVLGQKRYAEAEEVLRAGYEGLKAREKTIPPGAATRVPEAIDRLIELYTETGNPAGVTKWRAERAKYPFVAPPPRAAGRVVR